MKTQKYPLNEPGVNQQITDLYAKPDSVVEAAADAVSNDFFGWMTDTYELTSEQTQYMESLGDEFATENGRDLALAFRNRLPVTLTKGDISVRTSKFIRKEQNVTTVSEPDQATSITGEIHYFIT